MNLDDYDSPFKDDFGQPWSPKIDHLYEDDDDAVDRTHYRKKGRKSGQRKSGQRKSSSSKDKTTAVVPSNDQPDDYNSDDELLNGARLNRLSILSGDRDLFDRPPGGSGTIGSYC